MHAMVNSLLLMTLVVILSLFQLLPYPTLVNARKLASNNNAIFSVDLIRRDFSKTTQQGGGPGRLSLGSVSHSHHITLSSTFYDGKNVQTDVTPDGGAYDMKISIGTPSVEFTAIADTGSDLVWVQCSPCQQCIAQQSPLFDPTQSSTDKTIACTSQACNNDQGGLLAVGCSSNDDNSCIYEAGYGGGTRTSGVLSMETISFPSTSFPNFIFGCGYDQEGQLDPNGDGIVGLGGGPLSLVSQLGPQINYKFSYCLTPKSSEVNSKLNFGLDVTGQGVVSTPLTKLDTFPIFYYLTLDSISIGDTFVPVATNVIIDSGTTLTILPSNVYDGVKTAVKAGIGLSPVADPNQVFDPCYETESFSDFPDVVFHFSGADVVLKAENTFRMTGDDIACLAIVPSDDTFIFGNVAQVNFHVGYDLQANQVSFAPADCTKF